MFYKTKRLLFNHLLKFPTLERERKLAELCSDISLQVEVKSLLDSYKVAEEENFSLSLEKKKNNHS